MKNFLKILLLIAFIPFTTQAEEESKFKDGTHYYIIKKVATPTPEVVEFFSFYCPHCLTFEPAMLALKESLPDSIEVKKNHVNFLGKGMGKELTLAYAAAEALNIEDKISSLIFDRIHTQRKEINGPKGVLEIFAEAGVAEEEAEAALSSFMVNGAAAYMQRRTEELEIRGVPALIVNGKFSVNLDSVRSHEELAELVSYLAKQTD